MIFLCRIRFRCFQLLQDLRIKESKIRKGSFVHAKNCKTENTSRAESRYKSVPLKCCVIEGSMATENVRKNFLEKDV